MLDPLRQVKAAGVRLTKVRQVVLNYLQEQGEPQTVAAIHRAIGGRGGVDLASVYRTVELLERLGLATREQHPSGAIYVLADRHHHHIVCRSCRRQACLPCAGELPRSRQGFTAVQHQVMFSGLCATCAR